MYRVVDIIKHRFHHTRLMGWYGWAWLCLNVQVPDSTLAKELVKLKR